MRTVTERAEQARPKNPVPDWLAAVHQRARDIAARHVRRIAYVDYTAVWTTRFLRVDEWRELGRHCGKAFQSRKRRTPEGSPFKLTLVMAQPTAAGLACAHDVVGRGYKVIGLEETLDCETQEDRDKDDTAAFFDEHWWLPHRPDLPTTAFRETSWAAWDTEPIEVTLDDGTVKKIPQTIRNNNKQYPMRKSKLGGVPCHHIERVQQTTDAIGLDLIGIAKRDRRRFWSKVMQLRAIDFAALARAMRVAATGKPEGRGRVDDEQRERDAKTGRELAALFAVTQSTDWGCRSFRCADAVTAAIKTRELDIRSDRILRTIPNTAFLPDVDGVGTYLARTAN